MDFGVISRGLRQRPRWQLIVFLAGAIAALLTLVFAVQPRVSGSNDIPYTWAEGRKIVEGKNPYASIAGSDMRHVHAPYAIYLPGFYLVSALTYALGATRFETWLGYWFVICLLLHWAIGATFWAMSWSSGRFWLGLPLALFAWFNRWALLILAAAGLDFLMVALLLASLLLWGRYRRAAYLVFGLSLAIKPVGVMLMPLLVLWEYLEAAPEVRWQKSARALGLILVIPIAVSAPFIVWQPDYFLRSIFFSLPRVAQNEYGVLALDGYLGLESTVGKLPLVAMLVAVYWAAYQRAIGKAAAIFFVLMIAAAFSPIYLAQYLYWMAAFVPFAALEWFKFKPDVVADEREFPATGRPGLLPRPEKISRSSSLE